MPCDSGMGNSYYDDSHLRREIERLTRVSCETLRALEAHGYSFGSFTEETRKWWEQHKAHDAAREAAERAAKEREELRKSALAKLTPEERKSLGIP